MLIIYFSYICRYVPNVICGDLDSARQEVLSYYKERVSVCSSGSVITW